MSKEVDERVVSMQFDNRNFEANANKSMNTIEKLKRSLDFKGASKGIEELGKASKNIDFSKAEFAATHAGFHIQDVFEKATRFLENNIANRIVNIGTRIAKDFTITPVFTGFQEYETQINAIQTILANTSHQGTTLEQVNAALDELNRYADKTIYNFTQMTRNIGTFTAAGLDLDTSVKAIQGIANLAAVSGSTSQQASTAMYQLSQALSAGTVQLMDWNSVVNAGMGGKVFQDAIINTVKGLGNVNQGLIQAYESGVSFRQLLNPTDYGRWFTSDILAETLKKFTKSGSVEYIAKLSGTTEESILKLQQLGDKTGYTSDEFKKLASSVLNGDTAMIKTATDVLSMATTAEDAATKVKTFTQLMDTLKEAAQSGWTQSWEIIIGDFGEAKVMFTKVSDFLSDIINKSAESRNSVLEGAFGSKWDSFISKVNDAGVSTEDFTEKLKETYNEADKNGVTLEELIDQYGSLAEVISKGRIPASVFIDTLKKFVGPAKAVSDTTEDVNKKLEELQNLFDKVWQGDFGNGADRVKAFADANLDYATVQELVDKHTAGYKLTLEDLSDEQLKSIGYTEEQVSKLRELAEEAEKTGTPLNELIAEMTRPTGRELLIDSVRNAVKGLCQVLGAVKKAWREAFYGNATDDEIIKLKSERLYKLMEIINKLSKHLVLSEDTVDKLTRTYKGLFAAVDLVTTIIGGGFKFAIKLICKLLGMADVDILSITANLGDAIVKFRDWVFENNIFAKGLSKSIELLGKAIKAVRDWIKEFLALPQVQSAITKLKGSFSKFFGELPGFFGEGLQRIIEFIGRCKEMDSISLENIKIAFTDFKDNVLDYFVDGFLNGFKKIGKIIVDFKDQIKTNLENVGVDFEKIGEKLSVFGQFVKDWLPFAAAIGIGLGLIIVIRKLTKAILNFKNVFGELVDAFANFINAKAFEAKTKGIKNLAVSIAILAGSLFLLTQLDQKKLWSSAGALTLITVALGGLAFAISKMQNVGDTTAISLSILAISASLIMIVSAIKKLGAMSDADIERGVGAVTGITAIIGMLIALSKLSGEHASKAGALVLKVGAALLLFVWVTKIASKMDEKDVKKGLGVIASIELLIIGLIAVSKLSGEHAKEAGDMIIKVGWALLLMTWVMKSIAKMDEKDIEKGIEVITKFELLIMGLIATSKLSGKHAKKAGDMIIKIGIAMLAMAYTMKIISGLSESDVKKGLSIIKTFELLAIALVAVSKLAGKHAAKAGTMILEISAALMMLTSVMYLLKGLSAEDVTKGLTIIGVLEALMGGLIFITKYASETKGIKGIIISLTVAIILMSGAIYALSTIDQGNLRNATICLSAILGVFALLMFATRFLSEGADNWKQNAVSLIVLAGVVAGLAYVMTILSQNDPGNTIKIAASMGILILALAGACKILGDSEEVTKKARKAAFTMALVMLALGGVLVLISTLSKDPVGMIAAATSISIMTLTLAETCKILSTSKAISKSAQKSAFILSGIMAMLGLALGIMLNVAPKNPGLLITGAAAMSAMIISLAAACKVLASIRSVSKSAYTTAAILGLIMGGIAIIFGILMPITSQCSNVLETATALSMILLSLSASCAILSLVGRRANDALIAAGAMAAIMAAIAVILGILASSNIGPTLEIATSLSMMLLALSTSCLILAGASVIAGMASVGVKALITVIVAVGLLMTAIAGLATWYPGLEEFISKALPILKLLGEGIGEFVGGILKGIGSAVIELIPIFGNALSDFMENLNRAFIPICSSIDMSLLQGAGILAGSIAVLTAAELVSQIGSFFGVGFLTLGKELSAFMESLDGFFEGLNDLDEGTLAAASSLGLMILSITAADLIAGITRFLGLGDGGFEKFGEMLVPFGESMVEFSNVIKSNGGIDQDAVEAAAKAGMIMVELAKEIPNSGGILGFIMGNNDLDDFGRKLVSFGNSICLFSNAIVQNGGIDQEAVDAAAKAGMVMVELAKEIPNSGGILGFIMGDNDIDVFGRKLVSFGNSICLFSNTIVQNGGINQEAVEAAATAGKIMTTLADDIPNSGGLIGMIMGDNDIDDFGDKLVTFGEDLVDFANEVVDLDTDAVDRAEDAASMLVSLAKAIPKDDSGWFTKGSMEAFGDNIITLGSDIATFASKIEDCYMGDVEDAGSFMYLAIQTAKEASTINYEHISQFGVKLGSLGESIANFSTKISESDLTGIDRFYEAMGKLGTGSIDQFISAFERGSSNATKLGGKLIQNICTGVKDNSLKIKDTVSNVVEKAISNEVTMKYRYLNYGKDLSMFLVNGMKIAGVGASKTVKDILTSCTSTISGNYQSFYDCGSYLVDGFSSGISANTFKAEASAAAMATAAYEAAKVALDINSPSKIFRALGYCVPEGLADGVDKMSYMSEDSTRDMATNALNAAKDVISKMSFDMNSDAIAQPTIRPVLDLSDVTSEAGKIGSLFDSNPSVGVLANVNSLSSSMTGINQNGSNRDVIKAINDLGQRLDSNPGTSYIINGITYDDGSAVSEAVEALVRAAVVEGRV